MNKWALVEFILAGICFVSMLIGLYFGIWLSLLNLFPIGLCLFFGFDLLKY